MFFNAKFTTCFNKWHDLQGAEPECEVTEVEVRVDPMLFLCALEEDDSTDDEDNTRDNTSCPRASPSSMK